MRKLNKAKILLVVCVLVISSILMGKIIYSKNEVNNKVELEGTIRFISNRTDKKKELEELISEFEKLNPKVKVELELIGDAESILYRMAIVEELPDVTLIPGAIRISEYNRYFLPLDDLGFNNDNIYNYSLGIGTDNELYNLTTSITWNGIIYNKRVFEEAGIDNIPSTNEEFFEACSKIKSIGITPIALNYRQGWAMGPWVDVIPYFFDSTLESDVFLGEKDILDEESGLFQSLNILREIVQNKYCEQDLLNYEWQLCKSDVKNGNVAMFFGNSGFRYQLEDIGMNPEDIGMFPMMGSQDINVYGDYKFGVAKNTKYPEVSKAFLSFIFENDRYVNAVNILSSLKDSEKNKEFFKDLEEFNVPINIYGETLVDKEQGIVNDEEESEVEVNIHEYYDKLKSIIGLDYSFAQSYSICDNPDELRENMNIKWNELKENILFSE